MSYSFPQKFYSSSTVCVASSSSSPSVPSCSFCVLNTSEIIVFEVGKTIPYKLYLYIYILEQTQEEEQKQDQNGCPRFIIKWMRGWMNPSMNALPKYKFIIMIAYRRRRRESVSGWLRKKSGRTGERNHISWGCYWCTCRRWWTEADTPTKQGYILFREKHKIIENKTTEKWWKIGKFPLRLL